jgi:hypothetical protein
MVHEKISKNSQKIALIEHFETTPLEIIPVFLHPPFYHTCPDRQYAKPPKRRSY